MRGAEEEDNRVPGGSGAKGEAVGRVLDGVPRSGQPAVTPPGWSRGDILLLDDRVDERSKAIVSDVERGRQTKGGMDILTWGRDGREGVQGRGFRLVTRLESLLWHQGSPLEDQTEVMFDPRSRRCRGCVGEGIWVESGVVPVPRAYQIVACKLTGDSVRRTGRGREAR